ncbi:MAG: cyclic nucleotide-binding domain-containing protein [Deltaproteobacteria bacterium]|nr:cyclic nucleotide-binding domain-containing protein [Deltaproteobacteria bacterium]
METGSALLDALSAEERARLLAGADMRTFSDGDVLIEEGADGSSILFISEGEVQVTRAGANLAVLTVGAAIGEMALLDPAPRSATVVAKGAVEVIELDRATVWGMLAAGDSAAVKILQGITATVCARLGDVNQKVQEEVVRPRGNVFKRLFSSVFKR